MIVPKFSSRFVLVIFALLFFIAAFMLYRSAVETATAHNWVPLSESVSLAKGKIITRQFIPDGDTSYFLELTFERKIELRRLNCLLGIGVLNGEECKKIASILDVDWAVIGDDGVKASGSRSLQSKKSGGSWGRTIGTRLGNFKVEPHRPYKIELQINSDASELNIANPKLRVRVGLQQYKNAVVSSQIKNLAAMIFGGLALLLLISYLILTVYEAASKKIKTSIK